MSAKSGEHEASLQELRATVDSLSKSDSALETFKKTLEDRDDELKAIKEKMKVK